MKSGENFSFDIIVCALKDKPSYEENESGLSAREPAFDGKR